MHRLRSWFQLRLLYSRAAWREVVDNMAFRQSAWAATARTLVRRPALVLALPLVHVMPADADDRRLVTSTAMNIAPLATDAPHALRVARLLAAEHQGTVVMDTVPLRGARGEA